jgi:hypothetical protein
MGKAAYHMATVTLKLPFEITHDEELAALRAAGIPVDDQGVAESGFLHMRTTSDYRSHVFRWFASGGPADGLGRVSAPNTTNLRRRGHANAGTIGEFKHMGEPSQISEARPA